MGNEEGLKTTEVPRLIYTPAAVRDLVRLRQFLESEAPEVAARAAKAIKSALGQASRRPLLARPAPSAPVGSHELVITFGATGYIARYFYDREKNLVIVERIWHQRELGL